MSQLPLILTADPAAGYRARKAEIDSAVQRVLDSGWYILGAEVKAFEHEFAAWLGLPHVLGVANGTDALHLALRACGVGPGDFVLTVSHTAVATVAAIELAGAVPILLDVDEASYTLCAARLEATLASFSPAERPRLKALIIVHLYGHPAEVDTLIDLARRYELKVIEDCAQCHGALFRGRMTGTLGDIAAFSFYPTKNLGALGDGGAVATADPALAERVRLLREYGWRERYISALPGMNSRLDEIQAAILRVKLRHLPDENGHRREIACAYHSDLATTGLGLPAAPAHVSHVYHQYVVRTPHRDDLKAALAAAGIAAQIHYPAPVHLQPAYAHVRQGAGGLQVTARLCTEVLSLPMHGFLDEASRQRVAHATLAWAARAT